MERRLSAYTGCLLGLAVGDGLGHGPDRINGFLPTSSYTQQAAYACCGLLVGMTREEAIRRLDGIHCGPRPTSCPDQLAQALKQAKAQA